MADVGLWGPKVSNMYDMRTASRFSALMLIEVGSGILVLTAPKRHSTSIHYYGFRIYCRLLLYFRRGRSRSLQTRDTEVSER
jgi:hypothetical protein